MDEKKTTEQKIEQLQRYEQSLQSILMQKQQFRSQTSEISSALQELESAKEQYKIIGNIMVNAKKEELKKDLTESSDKAELRVKALEKQEEDIKNKVKDLQKEIMENMKE